MNLKKTIKVIDSAHDVPVQYELVINGGAPEIVDPIQIFEDYMIPLNELPVRQGDVSEITAHDYEGTEVELKITGV